ncbi:hypothetical protein BC827DRAFT_1370571 [Russula dissimulans]|nr:hypothetical protein BC827DRAFT_1370571 [Russula dissimulans]
MASLSIPPPAAPTPTRLDWRQTGERSSTIRSVNKSRGGAGPSDRGRGGRGARRGTTSARGGKEKSTDTAPKPAPSIVVEPPEKPRAGSRRAPQNAAAKMPSLTIQLASPTTPSFGSTPHSASTTASKLSTRRRRSNNKISAPATISSENLTVEMLASAMKARKSRSGPSSPHAKESPSEKSPPNLSAGPTVASFSTKSNIDSLVEHVRALAMDHRPSTPGSHIDWAGDEDDSLPDLDDWGVPSSSVASGDLNPGPTTSTEKARLQLMSPILDDSLKQLPQNFDKITPSPSVGSGSLSPNIANGVPLVPVPGLDNGVGVAEAPSSVVASLNDKSEAHSPAFPHRLRNQGCSPSVTPPIQPGRSLADSMHAPSHATTELESDADLQGLAASTNAPGTDSGSPESKSGTVREGPRSAPVPRHATHGRSHTLGRQPPFSAGAARRGFLSGSSTPAAPAAGVASGRGPHHGRTQSSPVTHRRQHSRPVITMDAMTRLAKTLGTAVPKREVVAAATVTTNSATSTE